MFDGLIFVLYHYLNYSHIHCSDGYYKYRYDHYEYDDFVCLI